MSVATAVEKTLMTAEEFFDFANRPENANKILELVRGEVTELPSPQKRHGVVTANVARILGNYTFARDKGYVAGNDSGVILARDPDTVRGPDVAVYEDASSWDELHPKYGEVAPRLAVEVLSPNDRPGKVVDKIDEYLSNGVDLVWVIDPEEMHAVVYRRGREMHIVRMDGELTGDDILPGLVVKLSDAFAVPGRLLTPAPTAAPPPPAGPGGSPGTVSPSGP